MRSSWVSGDSSNNRRNRRDEGVRLWVCNSHRLNRCDGGLCPCISHHNRLSEYARFYGSNLRHRLVVGVIRPGGRNHRNHQVERDLRRCNSHRIRLNGYGGLYGN